MMTAMRRLMLLSVLTAVLATVAAANLTLTYLLYSIDHPGISFAGFVPITAIGSVPFLVTAGFLAWAIRGNRPSPPGELSRSAVVRLRMITGFGLPFSLRQSLCKWLWKPDSWRGGQPHCRTAVINHRI